MLAVVPVVTMVGALMALTTIRLVGASMAMVFSVLSFIVLFFLRMKNDVVKGVTRREAVDLTRPYFNMSLDEWHAKGMAEGVGQAESFLAQRGSAEVATETFVLAMGGEVCESCRTDDAGDVVIIAIYVGVCQRMAKADVGIRIGWDIGDTDWLSYDEGDCGAKNS